MRISEEQRVEVARLYGPDVEVATDYGGKLKLVWRGFFVCGGSDFASLLRQAEKIDWRGIAGCVPSTATIPLVEHFNFRPVHPVPRGNFRAPAFERNNETF